MSRAIVRTATGLPSVAIEHEVPFHDLDPAGMVWHGNYAKYFELARCALLASFDYNYDQMSVSGFLWPVIDLRVKFVRPLRFLQRVKIAATLCEYEYRMRIEYLITDLASGARLTRGSTVQVAVDMKTEEMCLASPPILARKLGLSQ